MKKLNAVLLLLFIAQINTMAQKMDTTRIEDVLNKVLNAFEQKSFEDFEKLLFDGVVA